MATARSQTTTDGSLHDINRFYSWSKFGEEGPDGVRRFLGTLNDGLLSSFDGTITNCFANHCDSRLPTIEELSKLIDMAAPGCQPHGSPSASQPCIDPSLGPTKAFFYWSGTSHTGATNYAWVVNFSGGALGADTKDFKRLRTRSTWRLVIDYRVIGRLTI
jgi:hypothetical protein